MMTVAAIDRIIYHGTIIEIEGESYRKKQSLKNKLIFLTNPVRVIGVNPAKIVDARQFSPVKLSLYSFLLWN